MTSLPPSILLVQVGLTLVIVGVLAKLRVRQPFPVSSMPAGTAFRPGILVIIEDVVAVDGGRGRAYRSALMESQTFAFGLGVWAVITTYWVKSALREEKLTWSESQKVGAVLVPNSWAVELERAVEAWLSLNAYVHCPRVAKGSTLTD
ncbi:uncharacterized protein An19g00040 [Aspergillus niger]|uniref:Contig An19c0010, genomic contig n=2 Tax=Aspergillus niger TaxID=5061 RepID=A2RBI9_ASPNC|nr:uncharacterized protein An19g00040 [Aspergillus niger]CAK47327.1 unnamed protein product [Aspergillus niger]